MNLKKAVFAVLIEQDYQDMEVWYPVYRLRETGAEVLLVGTGSADVYKSKHGYPATVDRTADQIKESELAGLVIPGGWAPDKLRQSSSIRNLVRDMFRKNKPVACICHGGWVLASAEVLKGREVTSYPGIKDDMINAGAKWHDAEVIVDGNLVTSRRPDDLPAFMREFVGLFHMAEVEA
ncbi:MAG TPA: type 1 glutamine amidotransferase domain-containing protein [bacterium]|jgi:protease I